MNSRLTRSSPRKQWCSAPSRKAAAKALRREWPRLAEGLTKRAVRGFVGVRSFPPVLAFASYIAIRTASSSDVPSRTLLCASACVLVPPQLTPVPSSLGTSDSLLRSSQVTHFSLRAVRSHDQSGPARALRALAPQVRHLAAAGQPRAARAAPQNRCNCRNRRRSRNRRPAPARQPFGAAVPRLGVGPHWLHAASAVVGGCVVYERRKIARRRRRRPLRAGAVRTRGACARRRRRMRRVFNRGWSEATHAAPSFQLPACRKLEQGMVDYWLPMLTNVHGKVQAEEMEAAQRAHPPPGDGATPPPRQPPPSPPPQQLLPPPSPAVAAAHTLFSFGRTHFTRSLEATTSRLAEPGLLPAERVWLDEARDAQAASLEARRCSVHCSARSPLPVSSPPTLPRPSIGAACLSVSRPAHARRRSAAGVLARRRGDVGHALCNRHLHAARGACCARSNPTHPHSTLVPSTPHRPDPRVAPPAIY